MSPRQIPPLRHCRECGGHTRSWSEHPLCRACGSEKVAAIKEEGPLNLRGLYAERKAADAAREGRR
jgi:hypothetical protein